MNQCCTQAACVWCWFTVHQWFLDGK